MPAWGYPSCVERQLSLSGQVIGESGRGSQEWDPNDEKHVMTIAFTCPHCGKRTDVADRFAGQSGPCSSCGQTISVPTLGGPSYSPPPPRRRSLFGCLATGLICLLFLFCAGFVRTLLGPGAPSSWDRMRRFECRSNLEQIATAVSLYENDYGCFPPAYTTDKDGNRLHSWRTLLLPYLGEEAVYKSLDLEEPWDSEYNRVWHDTPIDVYQCPADSSGVSTDTSYVMIVGNEAVFDGTGPRKAVEVTDGVSKTILLVETTSSGIHWMEPRDLRWEDTDFAINGGMSISSEHEGGAHVMMCDGAVEFLKDDTPPSDVRAMATRAGKESVPKFEDVIEEDFSQ